MSSVLLMTVDEKRQLVLEYSAVPHGQKLAFLRARGVSASQFRRVRQEVVAGALEHGLIARGGAWVSSEENRELARLHKEIRQLKDQLEAARAESAQHARVADALGKAIELLQAGTFSTPKSSTRD